MKPAKEYRCCFTGRRAENLHHPTGRDGSGRYLDEAFTLPTVIGAHATEHSCWNAIGLADGVFSRPDVLRLRRTGHSFIRLADEHLDGEVSLPAESFREMGLMFHQIADRMEEECDDT